MLEIENKSSQSIFLHKKSLLGEIDLSCLMVGKVTTKLSDAQEEIIIVAESTAEPNVDLKYKKPIADLLHDFPNLFATENSKLGSTGLIKHSIDTQGQGPIRLRPYRTGAKQNDELRKQIKEMMASIY